MKLKLWFGIVVALVLVTSATLMACANTAPVPSTLYNWRLQVFMPANELLYKDYIAINLVNKISQATNGQIKITAYPGGALIPPPQELKAVAQGICEMAYGAVGFWAGFMPAASVLDSLPMSFRDPKDQLDCFFEGGMGDFLRGEYAKNGVHLLTIFATDPYVILAKKPMVSQADFQGLKIRSWGSWNRYLGLLKASPVDMALIEVYQGLAAGVVDGAITGITPHYENKHYEVCKFGMWPPLLGSAAHDIFINSKNWSELPDNLKSSVTKAAREWSYEYSTIYTKYWQETKQKLIDKGVKWQEVQDKDWLMKMAQQQWDEAKAKDEASAKAIDIMKTYLKKVGAIQ